MKRYIKSSEMRDFNVTVRFSGMVGVEEEYEEFEDGFAAAEEAAIEDALGDLNVEEIEPNGDGDYAVTFSWAGYVGSEATYYVTADDEDEAVEVAREEARADFDATAEEVD